MNRKKQMLVALAAVLVVCGFIVFRYFAFDEGGNVDPLCAMADEYHMRCVKLASPRVYDHGAYIRIDPKIESSRQISLPTDHIFSEHCSFAPEITAFAQFREDPNQYVNFGTHVFHIDRNLSAGVDLNLPRIAGLSLKAGPKISNIRSVTLEADSARYFNIDTTAFLNALNSCSVRPACASVIRSPGVQVIKRILVAKNLRYRIETTSGETESLSAAIRSKTISVGMDATGNATTINDLSSGQDMVFAIDFFDPAELQSARICEEPIAILKVTGTTEASALSGAQGFPGDRQSSTDGNEVVAHERAPDAPDRQPREGMKDPEARAWGLWNYDATTGTVALYQRTLVDPGTRWLSDSQLNEIPGSLKVWAVPKASIKNEVEITIVNELEETKILVGSAKLVVNASASLIDKIPLYSSFHPLTLTSQDGTQHHVPPVWRSNVPKDFELGRIKPGEIVKVRIGRTLESTGWTDADGGTMQEDLSISFSVK